MHRKWVPTAGDDVWVWEAGAWRPGRVLTSVRLGKTGRSAEVTVRVNVDGAEKVRPVKGKHIRLDLRPVTKV